MIFDNSKLAIIFVILFLIIVTSAFLILRTRFSGQPVAQNNVVTTATPSITETPRIITPQVINPSPGTATETIAPVVTMSPTLTPTLAPGVVGSGATISPAAVAYAPATGIGSALPNTSFPAVGIAFLAGVAALVGFRIRKFPE